MDKQSLLRSLLRVDDLVRITTDRVSFLPFNNGDEKSNVSDSQVNLPHGLTDTLILKCARLVLDDLRGGILGGKITTLPALDDIIDMVLDRAKQQNAYSLRPVINATGVVLHTNLGRAVLCPEAVQNVTRVASAYSTLEYDVAGGSRGSRHSHIESLICELTGAEAAMAVNNNAAAVMLALMTLCTGREVIVSRGELVEIGGSFRVPDIMKLSGAYLKEVGTTNKTKLSDYEDAIKSSSFIRPYAVGLSDSLKLLNNVDSQNSNIKVDMTAQTKAAINADLTIELNNTDCDIDWLNNANRINTGSSMGKSWELPSNSPVAALLKVHTSNFKIVGFSESVSVADLKILGQKYNIPVIYDLGSGLMGDELIGDISTGFSGKPDSNLGIADKNLANNSCENSEKHSINNANSLESLTGEISVLDSIKSGADVVCFSGDKLFGGPQAGIITGKKCYIDAIKKNQFARVVRIDKLTLAALEATLKAYSDPQKAVQIPTLANILAPLSVLKTRAEKLKKLLTLTKADLKTFGISRGANNSTNDNATDTNSVTNSGIKSGAKEALNANKNAKALDYTAYTVSVKQSNGQVGGGSAPAEDLPSYVVEVFSPAKSAATIEKELRAAAIPIIARIQKDRVLLDVRTIFDGDFAAVAGTLKRILLCGGGHE